MDMLTPPTTPTGNNIARFSKVDHTSRPYAPPAARPQPVLPPSLPLTPPATSTDRFQNQPGVNVAHWQSRQLTDNELSYYLPSRADGVNDMYVHHRLSGASDCLSESRVLYVWAYQLLRHPLLASSISAHTYEDVRFVRSVPSTLEEALQQAASRFHAVPTNGSIIDTYLNGPRTLSSDRLACLVFAHPTAPAFGLATPPSSPNARAESEAYDCELMLCATHAIGDGMALHTFMNEFYTLLGSSSSVADLREMILAKLYLEEPQPIPQGLESQLPAASAWRTIVGAVDSRLNQTRLTGNQSFPLIPASQRKPRQTVVPTVAYSSDETKRILSSCKANGVTVAHAVFALCNMAWARLAPSSRDPCIIYSAANLRPHIQTPSVPSSPESFFHLAIGYFNVSLPSLHVPIATSDLLWHRARSVRAQMMAATRSPFVVPRARRDGLERRERAVRWAKMDDGVVEPTAASEVISPRWLADAAPQKALMGVSMLGNLDGMYKHAAFPSIKLESLMTGSRQRSAGLLLFAYTFRGQLWLSLGYDENGFAPGVIAGFWTGLQGLVSEAILD